MDIGTETTKVPKLPICSHIDKSLHHCKKINKLWYLLSQTGSLSNFGGGIVTNPLKPQKLQSNLIGQSFLTDPSSTVRVVSFNNPGTGEPITTGGYVLETYNNEAIYQISWTLNNEDDLSKCKSSKVRIGFYTSDDFEFDITNKLFLICGNKGPAIFESTQANAYRGSFRCTQINRIYVAINKDVEVQLKIQVIMPSYIKYPIISEDHQLYTKYITLPTDRCSEKRKIAVYTIKPTDQYLVDLIKQETKCFKKPTKVIKEFLEDSSLLITLFSPINSTRFLLPPTEIYTSVKIGTINSSLRRSSYMNTNSLAPTGKATYSYLNDYVGLKTASTRCRVSFTITSKLSSFYDIFITGRVECQQPVNGLWRAYDTINGERAVTLFPGYVTETGPKTVSGSFELNIQAFSLTIYYIPINDQDYGDQHYIFETTFDEIKIEYL